MIGQQLQQQLRKSISSSSGPAILPVETQDQHFSHQISNPPDGDVMNFDYLRHVMLKFLLSRDSEVINS